MDKNIVQRSFPLPVSWVLHTGPISVSYHLHTNDQGNKSLELFKIKSATALTYAHGVWGSCKAIEHNLSKVV
jgi:hypothetical protein